MEKTHGATATEGTAFAPLGAGDVEDCRSAEHAPANNSQAVGCARSDDNLLATPDDAEAGHVRGGAERAGLRAADLSAPEWNEARVERLIELWGLGWSASLIAGDLGHLTRNAVLGKIHRMGISERENGYQQHPNCRRRADPLTPYEREQRKKQRIAIRQSRPPRQIPVTVIKKLPEPQSKGVSLFDLTATSCRFMAGEPSESVSTFCGHDVVEGHSWCAYHVGLVYTKRPTISDCERAARSFRAKKLLLERQRHNGVSRHFLMEGA